jgi:hypothetical protein
MLGNEDPRKKPVVLENMAGLVDCVNMANQTSRLIVNRVVHICPGFLDRGGGGETRL